MLPPIERLNSFARLLRPAALLAALCLSAAPARPQHQPPQRQPTPTPTPPPRRQPTPTISAPPVTEEQRRRRDILLGTPPSPTMRKPDALELPPSRARRSYDAARDATYVNVDVTLLAHRDVKDPKGVLRFEGREVTLTFQLAYRGARAYDLVSAYLIVESTAAPGDGDKLSAARQLEIKADLYEYAYERRDYQTELVAPVGATAQQLRKEIAAFKLPPEDLPQLANAGRLQVKLGAESFTVKSPQLTELRRTLATGDSR